MKPSILIAAVLGCVMLIGIVAAQVVLQPIVISDFQANGTNVGYFHQQPSIKKINFVGGASNGVATVGSSILTVGNGWSPYNPDGGWSVTPGGALIGTIATRPTCAAALRGLLFTSESNATADAGVKDTTAQCCKAANGTYSWISTVCN